jgi:two-component system, LytTR family, sensor kinase
MSHPFTSQRKALVIYIFIWLLIAMGNTIFLHFSREFSLAISVTESLLSVLLFGLLGLIAWYPTTYIPVKKDAPIYSVSAHIVAGVVIIAVWLMVTVGILGVLFGSDNEYAVYLSSSVFWRGFVGAMVYLVLVLVYYLVTYARSLRDRAQAEEKLRTLVKESELNMLKSQINPHFLFNSLNSISSLIMSNPDEAREMIFRLSDFLRYSLKHRESEFVPLEEELVRMKDYLAIEQIRFGDKLQYTMNTPGNCQQVKVPTMILQPLVENAIRHGVYESLDPVSVELACELDEGFLRIELVNDYDADQPSRRGTGVGLQNVSERIRLAYDGKGRMTSSAHNGVFRVTLYIPLESKE